MADCISRAQKQHLLSLTPAISKGGRASLCMYGSEKTEMWAVASRKLLEDMAVSSQSPPEGVGHQRALRTQRQRGDATGNVRVEPQRVEAISMAAQVTRRAKVITTRLESSLCTKL